MNTLKQFALDFMDILNEMAPYLLLGFLFAGILKVLMPPSFIDKHLSKQNFKSVLLSTVIGIPMPLCSCGVIPTGVSIYKNGASKGATISFLISTPQTGVDSILVTYSLLGLPFAIIRPIVALFTGLFGGILSNKIDQNPIQEVDTCNNSDCCCSSSSNDSCCSGESCGCNSNDTKHSKLYTIFKYAFVDFLQDISKWLIIGVLIAAFISIIIPENFFDSFIGNPWLEMLIILVVAIPLYVCATGSIPIVAVLMLKGLSPGAALVFLMAGPATNAATLTVLSKTIGKKGTWTYLFSITFGAVLSGFFINQFLPNSWFSLEKIQQLHEHSMLPEWFQWASTILLLSLILNGYYQKKKRKQIKANQMNEKVIIIKGMNCNHCKNSIESNLIKLNEINSVKVDLDQQTAFISGKSIDLNIIQSEIEQLGFEYGGIVEK